MKKHEHNLVVSDKTKQYYDQITSRPTTSINNILPPQKFRTVMSDN